MNFNNQSIEMKRTLLEAAIGSVVIASHSLELNLKIMLFSLLNYPDDKFDNEWEKPRTLGFIIGELRVFDVFDSEQMSLLNEVKEQRNKFTHRLSEFYMSSISNKGTMYHLFQEFNSISKKIDIATNMAKNRLNEMAYSGGVNVDEFRSSARKAVNNWEKANELFERDIGCAATPQQKRSASKIS